MKQKITNPNQDVELMAQEKPCDHSESNLAEDIEALYIYWLASSYPFMPLIDLTFVFDELRKIVKNWFPNKRERTNHS
ncbi:hypothetical protein HDF26_001154 [Pedobacter cryoconitis]|uniref:hypothetical protein n=1 Tax=Pedobacter cryoconitis TaxID=188932 RepID=UPI00161278A5|nr:hypothetical protein [Pedobacter cryoconitis]MBB6270727.1 hypothetical protein [Pedobacter cryoconitis]